MVWYPVSGEWSEVPLGMGPDFPSDYNTISEGVLNLLSSSQWLHSETWTTIVQPSFLIEFGPVRTGTYKDLQRNFSPFAHHQLTFPKITVVPYSLTWVSQDQAASYVYLWTFPSWQYRTLECLPPSFPVPLPLSPRSCCSEMSNQPSHPLKVLKSELSSKGCFLQNPSEDSTNSWIADLFSIYIKGVKQ